MLFSFRYKTHVKVWIKVKYKLYSALFKIFTSFGKIQEQCPMQLYGTMWFALLRRPFAWMANDG